MPGPHPVVGAWRVTVALPGGGTGTNLATLAADGTVAVVFPTPTPAPPGAGHALEHWTTALGAWQATGERTAAMTFATLGTDEHGTPVGEHVVTASVEASADGATWSGPFWLVDVGPDGKTAGSVDGTVSAVPIRPSTGA